MPRMLNSKSTEPKEKHELFDLKIDHVAVVDSPANMRPFFLLKRDDADAGIPIQTATCIPLFYNGEPTLPPSTPWMDIVKAYERIQEEERAATLNKMFNEASVEDKLQFLEVIQEKHFEADYHFLNKADKAQAELIERSLNGPFAEVLGALRKVRTAVVEEEEMAAQRESENFKRFFVTPAPAPVRKAAPAQGSVMPGITLNITMPNASVKKNVVFQRDSEGKVIGAEMQEEQP